MAEEATAPAATEAPATPVEGQAQPTPANDTTPADPKKPANDNATPEITEAQVIELADKYGPEKALQIIARKLNYQVDGATVSVAERKAFRDQQREAKAAIEGWKKSIADEWDGKIKEHSGEIEFGRALKSAKETGDYDGLARNLGFKDWNELTEDHIAKLADPNHKRLTELERKLQEKERAEQERAQQHEHQQRLAQQQAAEQAYRGEIGQGMKASSDPFLRELSDFPDVVNMLFAVQRQNYDRSANKTVTLEQAAMMPLPGQRVPIKEMLRSWQTALNKAFQAGEPAPAPAPAAKPKASGKTSPTPTPAPSATKNASDAREWARMGAQELEAAFRAEETARQEERRKGANGAG